MEEGITGRGRIKCLHAASAQRQPPAVPSCRPSERVCSAVFERGVCPCVWAANWSLEVGCCCAGNTTHGSHPPLPPCGSLWLSCTPCPCSSQSLEPGCCCLLPAVWSSLHTHRQGYRRYDQAPGQLFPCQPSRRSPRPESLRFVRPQVTEMQMRPTATHATKPPHRTDWTY